MRKIALLFFVSIIVVTNINAQDTNEGELLGLPGDNLDLYATLDLFQKSKTIEEFEASLNDEKTGVNNLDLNLDENVDFIKVVTQQDDDDFTFVLQVDVREGETQDVAVILVTKEEDDKVSLQMVGDEELYGKDYVIEPKIEAPATTANPAYSGSDTVVVKNEPATVVVVESEPIVEYIYSPVYVPYYPPYYYGYYPPYYRPYPVISINIYFGRNRHHRNHYYGGHRGGGNTVIINNNTYNNYSKTRNTSNTVKRNKTEGSYKKSNVSKPSTKPSAKPSVKPSTKPSTKQSAKPSSKPVNKPSAKPSTRPTNKPKSGGKKRKRN